MPSVDAPASVYTELQTHLERRSRELMDEVRAYPTPIARCDVQLPKLIEQRSRALRMLGLLQSLGPDRLAQFAAQAEWDDEDGEEAGLRTRLPA